MKNILFLLLIPFLYSCNDLYFSVEKGATATAPKTVPPVDVLEIGDELAGGIYAGEVDGYQLIATPGNCTDSLTPVCDGTTDSVLITKDITSPPNYCDAMSFGGYTDWYYPNLEELTQL